jgi:putative serine/threonine protein kinase
MKILKVRKMLKTSSDQLYEEPYATIMCYPKATKNELKNRLFELEKLRIGKLEFTGQKQLLNTHVLGKGCVGLVVLAYRRTGRVALKIRRTDADRSSMRREASLLRKANAVKVGPRLLGVTRNFLVMQYIEGDLLPVWLKKGTSKTRLKQALRNLLEQCWRLDIARLDHGELSHAPKHVIIDEKDEPFIIDFETSSTRRRPSNVTSMSQFLFLSKVSTEVVRKLGNKGRENMIVSLRRYKNVMDRENFLQVLKSCGL